MLTFSTRSARVPVLLFAWALTGCAAMGPGGDLCRAIEARDAATARSLIATGEIDLLGYYGCTPAEAALVGSKDDEQVAAIALAMIERGLDPNGRYQPPRSSSRSAKPEPRWVADVASEFAPAAVVEALVQRGMSGQAAERTMFRAVYKPSVVRLLLARGVSPNVRERGVTPLTEATIARAHETVALLERHGGQEYLPDAATRELFQAARTGDAERLQRALSAGARTDAVVESVGYATETPLIRAVKYGHAPVVQRLLAAGANHAFVDHAGYTALHYAARDTQLAVVQALRAAGADVNARRQGDWGAGTTPLGMVDPDRGGEIAVFLLSSGADVRAMPDGGALLLTNAASSENVALTRALVQAGMKPPKGLLPQVVMGCFDQEQDSAVLQLLVGAGADLRGTNGDGQTAREVATARAAERRQAGNEATARCHDAQVRLLAAAGAP